MPLNISGPPVDMLVLTRLVQTRKVPLVTRNWRGVLRVSAV